MELFFSVSDQDAILKFTSFHVWYFIFAAIFYWPVSQNLSQKWLGNIVLLKTVMKPGRFQNIFVI